MAVPLVPHNSGLAAACRYYLCAGHTGTAYLYGCDWGLIICPEGQCIQHLIQQSCMHRLIKEKGAEGAA